MRQLTEKLKSSISKSFPTNFEEAKLEISIPLGEFKIFAQGIYSQSMEDKWDIFLQDNIIYFARSWTHHCIYKVFTEQNDSDHFLLKKFQSNRNEEQHRSTIQRDIILIKKLIRRCLEAKPLKGFETL